MKPFLSLSQLSVGQKAEILAIAQGDPSLAAQLEDNGFLPGESIEICSRGVLGGTPIAVRLGRAFMALRREEADAIEVMPR